MKTIQFAKLTETNSVEVIRTVEVTERELNLVLESQGYTQNGKNQYTATENFEIKIIRVLN